jgi:hypothetical protein
MAASELELQGNRAYSIRGQMIGESQRGERMHLELEYCSM